MRVLGAMVTDRAERHPVEPAVAVAAHNQKLSAWPEVTPNTPMATAMASSKSLDAAENASAAVRG